MMTESYENWEKGIDWSRRTSVVGGPVFYEFIKTQALPTLDEGIQALDAAKAACEDKMRRWGAIAERAGKLAESRTQRRCATCYAPSWRQATTTTASAVRPNATA